MEQSILIADEVAEILRVDRQRVYELVRTNAIPFIKLGERQYRFSRPAIENWLGLNSQTTKRGESRCLTNEKPLRPTTASNKTYLS
jgi:excisionase family DNA binding protein